MSLTKVRRMLVDLTSQHLEAPRTTTEFSCTDGYLQLLRPNLAKQSRRLTAVNARWIARRCDVCAGHSMDAGDSVLRNVHIEVVDNVSWPVGYQPEYDPNCIEYLFDPGVTL